MKTDLNEDLLLILLWLMLAAPVSSIDEYKLTIIGLKYDGFSERKRVLFSSKNGIYCWISFLYIYTKFYKY